MAFTEFSAFEYVLISTANAFDKDKLLFEDRIQWVVDNAQNLRTLAKDPSVDYNLAMRHIIEIERLVDNPSYQSGLRIGLDACASGVQMLSVLAACITSASRVGLVDPNKRCDVYTDLQGFMNKHLPVSRQIGSTGSQFTRNDLKDVFMTYQQ